MPSDDIQLCRASRARPDIARKVLRAFPAVHTPPTAEMVACSVRTKEHRSRERKELLTCRLQMGTGLSHGCAHFEERKDGDGRCVIFVFLDARRRWFTLTLRPRSL